MREPFSIGLLRRCRARDERTTAALLALTTVAAALTLAACGASGPTSSPLNVVEAFDADALGGHFAAACELLTTRERDQIEEVAAVAQTAAACPSALRTPVAQSYLSTQVAAHKYIVKADVDTPIGYPKDVREVHVTVKLTAYVDVYVQDQGGRWLIYKMT